MKEESSPNKNGKQDDDKSIVFEHENIDGIINGIYDGFKEKLVNGTEHKHIVLFDECKKRESIDVHNFIGQCCVVFWCMVLFKSPTMRLSHETFWIDNYGEKYTEIEGCIDLKNCKDEQLSDKEMVKYCGVPGVIVENKEEKKNKDDDAKEDDVILIEPHIFIHDHKLIVNALKAM